MYHRSIAALCVQGMESQAAPVYPAEPKNGRREAAIEVGLKIK